MIKKELFKNKRVAIVAAVLSGSMSLSGCASAVQTNAEIVTTNQVESETDTVAETPSSFVAETEEVQEEQDTVAPTITVSNLRIEVIEGADINLMDGVRASDEKDGDLTSNIMVSKYDTSIVDVEQTITYTVSDEAGNEATATAVILIKSNPIEPLDKTMYTTSSVNVRSGSSQDSEKLGSLSYAQEVHVTGKDKNTDWYQIEYNRRVSYVSGSYLSDIKPSPKIAPTTNQSNSNKDSGNGSIQASEPQPDNLTQTPAQPDNSGSSGGSGFKIHDPGDIDNRDHSFSDEAIAHGW